MKIYQGLDTSSNRPAARPDTMIVEIMINPIMAMPTVKDGKAVLFLGQTDILKFVEAKNTDYCGLFVKQSHASVRSLNQFFQLDLFGIHFFIASEVHKIDLVARSEDS